MIISRKTEICGWPGSAHPEWPDTFPLHDERMRRFQRHHGGTAGIEAAVMMKLPLYVMPFVNYYGGSAGFINEIDLPVIMVMKRPPLRILRGN